MLMVGDKNVKEYLEEVLRRSFSISVMTEMNLVGRNRKTNNQENGKKKYGFNKTKFCSILCGTLLIVNSKNISSMWTHCCMNYSLRK